MIMSDGHYTEVSMYCEPRQCYYLSYLKLTSVNNKGEKYGRFFISVDYSSINLQLTTRKRHKSHEARSDVIYTWGRPIIRETSFALARFNFGWDQGNVDHCYMYMYTFCIVSSAAIS